jgi:hypothetical protein
MASLEKDAGGEFIARLGRWLATDVPHTPRLLMRHRSHAELDALESGIRSGLERHVDKPFSGLLRKAKMDKAVELMADAGRAVVNPAMLRSERKEWAKRVGQQAVDRPAYLAVAHSPIAPPGAGLVMEGLEAGKRFFINRTPGLPMMAKAAFPSVLTEAFADEVEKISVQLKELPGGKAHNHHLEEFSPEQLDLGFKVEREHTKDPKKRLEIAADHLVDDKKYYTKLDKAGLADELEKMAGPDLFKTLMAIQGGMGVGELAAHGPWGKGGQSPLEASAARGYAEAKKNLKAHPLGTPGHEEARKDFIRSAKKYRGRVETAEQAGAGLGMAGAAYGGYRAAGALGNRFMQSEAGLKTPFATTKKLRQTMAPASNIAFVSGGADKGLSIPKGGLFPKFMRPIEKKLYMDALGKTTSKDPAEIERVKRQAARIIEHGFQKGVEVLPSQVGAHVHAHELGHSAIGASKFGKILRGSRLPLGVGSAIAAGYMASKADTDSKTSKLAPLVGAAGIAPHLGEEAWASFKAMKGLKQIGTSAAELALAKKQLGRAWGTHALAFGLPVVAIPALITAARKFHKGRREKKGLISSDSATKLFQQAKAVK